MQTLRLVVLAALIAPLTGCSGGSSGTEPPPAAPQPTYLIGGSVAGVKTGSLILELRVPSEAPQTLSVTTDGDYNFATGIPSGRTYTVAIDASPEDHTCTVANGTGTADADVTDVRIECDYTVTMIAGVAQKGPFAIGSDVRVHELDDALERTGVTHAGLTDTIRGGFELTDDVVRGFIEIEVEGRYFDEHRGVVTTNTGTLRTLARVDPGEGVFAAVNVVSTLTFDRIKRLVTVDHIAFDDAVVQARRELFEAYELAYDEDDLMAEPDFLAGEGVQSLIISLLAVTLGDGYLGSEIATVANDFADNGELNSVLAHQAAHLIDDVAVRSRLEAYAAAAGDTSATVADILGPLGIHEVWLVTDGLLPPGIVVQLGDYDPVTITEDGRWLLANVPHFASHPIRVLSYPEGASRYCPLDGVGVISVKEDKEIEVSCFEVTADLFVVVEGLPEPGPVPVILAIKSPGQPTLFPETNGRHRFAFLVEPGTYYNVVLDAAFGVPDGQCEVVDGEGTVTFEQILATGWEIEVLIDCSA